MFVCHGSFLYLFFFCKQKTSYDMRISDWSSDVCSSDLSMVFEPLVKYQSDGSTVPWLARSWAVSEDGRTYRFELRDDVRFSNGEQFTAHTVQENFRAVLDNIDRHRWLELANQISRFEAIDDYTFELELKSPYYPIDRKSVV